MTTLLAKKKDGSSELIRVDFPSERLDDLVKFATDENRIIELHCDRPPGWADTLAPESRIRLTQLSLEAPQAFMRKFAQYAQARMQNLADRLGDLIK